MAGVKTEAISREMAEARRRRREKIIILVALALVALLTWIESRLFSVEIELPLGGNVLIFALININVLLLLLVVFLVVRNVVKLIFENRRNILGAKLKTKMVVAFVFLSLIPTILLFFVSLQFVSTSLDYWFSSRLDRSLQEALSLGKAFYSETQERLTDYAHLLAIGLSQYDPADTKILETYVKKKRLEYRFDTLELFDASLQLIASSKSPELKDLSPSLPPSLLAKALAGETVTENSKVKEGLLIRVAVPVYRSGEPQAVLAVGLLLNPNLGQLMEDINRGYETYRQLKFLKQPIKVSLIITLALVTLLIILVAVWFGFRFARGITEPVQALAEATHRVAGGDLDFVLEVSAQDELASLIEAFNTMTRDLKESKLQAEEATRALERSHQELARRHSYIETILRNVAAGVISIDASGRVTTVNRFAEELLEVSAGSLLGKPWPEILTEKQRALAEGFLEEARKSPRGSVQRTFRLKIREKEVYLLATLTILRDEAGEEVGAVLVFDDLTEREKIQRMAAWREVARRIAHEVKNPLTPIQLSAQRLRRRYLERLGPEEGAILDRCTKTIENQVEELRRLVNEFSSFARMPAARLAPNDLLQVVEETLSLYREAHREISFELRLISVPPVFAFDRDQLKRALINLLDNAVASLPQGGRIWVEIETKAERVRLVVADSGPGISPEDKPRLFEPYFSRKKGGTGLGLAIVNSIITEHNGKIWVEDNHPQGARFVMELPLVKGPQ
ncbi:ATP-binding protein [Thermosulfuriphilus sp.]